MRLNLETDYGLLCLLYLAEKNKCISSEELKEAVGIHTPDHVRKVLRKLRQSGFVETKRGSEGGYMLKKKASDILLGEVIEAMEDTICLNRCLEEGGVCSLNRQDTCPLKKCYQRIQKSLGQEFYRVTIQDILDENYGENKM